MLDQTPDSIDETTVGYSLLQTLAPTRTFLCTDVSSNVVVLKKLEDDCLYRQNLHPSIKERLAHVRNLPHSRLATLRGVERWSDSNVPFMVWAWLDGETWDDALARSSEDFGSLSSAMVEAVDALHEMGIVHGNLHGRNIIVRPDRQVWLTHVSPYLYTDPAGDIASIVDLLRAAGMQLAPAMPNRLSAALDQVQSGDAGLRELSRSLRSLSDDEPEISISPTDGASGYRVRSLVYAAAVAVVGAALFIGIRWFCSAQTPTKPATFPSLKPDLRPSDSSQSPPVHRLHISHPVC